MNEHRLTLDLDEETHARWDAAAKRIEYDRLDEWARDTLDAASDPDAGQVVDLAARLSAAETEREQLREFLAIADERAGTEHTNRVLAEARVEAAENLLAREMYAACGIDADGHRSDWDSDSLLSEVYDDYLARARAALSAGQKEQQ